MNRQPITFYMSSSTHSFLKEVAKREATSISELIRQGIVLFEREYLDRQQARQQSQLMSSASDSQGERGLDA